MKAFKLKYVDGSSKVLLAKSSLELIKKYDLATREHVNTRIIELSGEQEAIAFSNTENPMKSGNRMSDVSPNITKKE